MIKKKKYSINLVKQFLVEHVNIVKHYTQQLFEPPMYECWLHEPTFINGCKAITENHCGNYKPTRKYKKYLKALK